MGVINEPYRAKGWRTWLQAMWYALREGVGSRALFKSPGGFWPCVRLVYDQWTDPKARADIRRALDEVARDRNAG